MSWREEILKVFEGLPSRFSLRDVYDYVSILKSKFPSNNNVEAKIRQQLQLLRDDGYIESLDYKGNYRKRK